MTLGKFLYSLHPLQGLALKLLNEATIWPVLAPIVTISTGLNGSQFPFVEVTGDLHQNDRVV